MFVNVTGLFNADYLYQLVNCFTAAAVEHFTSWVASARRRDRTVQTASKDVSVWARLRRSRSLLNYLLTYLFRSYAWCPHQWNKTPLFL